ncbi:MAG: Glucodextranase, domain [Candidatus Parcubacteria bacterium]|jgi:cytoskeletal protein RodZ
MSFLHKRVGRGEGLFGADLRDLRESQGITIAQASHDTKLHDAVLHALEEDRVQALGDLTFSERHLLAYVRYLGGHESYFVARYRQRIQALHAERDVHDVLPRTRRVRQWDFFVGPQLLAFSGLVMLALLVGGYVLWQAHLVRIPPPLEVTQPVEGLQVVDARVFVQGRTMPEAHVTVNGRDAVVDPTGAFSLSLDVRRGTTLITIVARRRRGSETLINRSVLYTPTPLSKPPTQESTTTTSSTLLAP